MPRDKAIALSAALLFTVWHSVNTTSIYVKLHPLRDAAFENGNIKSKKWILVIVSNSCSENVQILIGSPLDHKLDDLVRSEPS